MAVTSRCSAESDKPLFTERMIDQNCVKGRATE